MLAPVKFEPGVLFLFTSFNGQPYFAGCFARDPAILRQVGHALLQLPFMNVRQPRRFLVAEDCFKLSLIPNQQSVAVVVKSIQKLLGRMCFAIS